jgi:hypothetical protein
MGTVGLETQPGATTYELDDLVANAWQGQVRVPHFQRDFRWTTQDVLRLFDSIVKGYPIGSLLLWVRKSPDQDLTLGRLKIQAHAYEDTLWVVDGQQRITSLANALHPYGHLHAPFSVHYDLAARLFIAQPKTRDPQHIPLPVLFDLEKLIEWFATEGSAALEYFKEAQRVAKRLRQFRVPAYLVRQDDEKILTDIFDRMNNYGKRLSRAEIFSALFAGPEEGAEDRLSLSRIADRVAGRTGFGTIDTDTVLSSILARRGPDPARDIRNEFDTAGRRTAPEFPGEDRDTAYEQGEEALVRAVEFLQNHAGVPHFALLAYRALLVVLTRFFAHFPEPPGEYTTAAAPPVLAGGGVRTGSLPGEFPPVRPRAIRAYPPRGRRCLSKGPDGRDGRGSANCSEPRAIQDQLGHGQGGAVRVVVAWPAFARDRRAIRPPGPHRAAR